MKKVSVLLILLIVLVYYSGGAYARSYDAGFCGNYYYATVTAEDGLVAEDGTRFEKDEIVVVSGDCLMDDGRIYVCIVKDEEDHDVYVTGREQLAGIAPDPETGLGEYAPFDTSGYDELGHAPYDPEANYVAIKDTYLTAGPGRLYEIVCTIPKGTKVKELPNGFNEYYRLEDQYGNKGWAVVWGPGNFACTTNIDGYYIEDTTLESEDDESEIVVKAGEKLHFESFDMGPGPWNNLERNGRVYSAPQDNLMILEKDDKEVCYMEDCTLLDENLNECDMVIKAGEKVHFVASGYHLVSSDYTLPLIHLEYNGQSFYTNNENYMEIHDEGIEACCMEDTVLLDADLKKTDIVVSAGETVYVDAEWGRLLHFDYKGQSFYSYRNSFLIYDDGEKFGYVYGNQTLYKDPFLKEPSEIQLETGWDYRHIRCGDVTCIVVDDERYYINNKEKTTGVRGAEAFDQAMAKVARYATPTEAESTEAPTMAPTEAPTMAPTEAPTMAPTAGPTEAPTVLPTVSSTPDLVLTDIYEKKEKEKNNIYIGIGAAAIAVVVAIIGIILLCRGKEDNNGQE